MLEEDIIEICERTKFPKKMVITNEDRKKYNNEKVYHIFKESLGNDKVRDHCHMTGKYRGAAHNSCNTKYQIPKFFPVIFHNLSGYDCHLFIKKLAHTGPGDQGSLADGKLNCIPNKEEKYISFSKEIKVERVYW